MFGWFKKKGDEVSLDEYLNPTKRIVINGVRFEIKKIALEDHLSGLQVILNMWQLYQVEKPTDPVKVVEDHAKLRKFMRDFIYAGTIKPKLTLKSEVQPGEHLVDDILKDLDLSQKLCHEIISFSQGKKK